MLPSQWVNRQVEQNSKGAFVHIACNLMVNRIYSTVLSLNVSLICKTIPFRIKMSGVRNCEHTVMIVV